MLMDLAEMRRRFERIRDIIEATPADQEFPMDVIQEAIHLSREADRYAEDGPTAVTPTLIRDFMLAHKLPTTLKERTGHYTRRLRPAEKLDSPTTISATSASYVQARAAVVNLMQEHWQDPAGFHEAIAHLYGIREEEYEPNPVEQIARWLEDPANNVDERAADDIASEVRERFL